MKNLSVLIVNEKLDHKGIISNTSFVLGLTAGRELAQETFGPDVKDGDGSTHKHLTNIGHFVRRAGQNKIKTLRKEFLDRFITRCLRYHFRGPKYHYNNRRVPDLAIRWIFSFDSRCGSGYRYDPFITS